MDADVLFTVTLNGVNYPCLKGKEISIGRTDKNVICVPSASVSSQHAKIYSPDNKRVVFADTR